MNSLTNALVAANVGIIIFFSSIVTPIVFKKLESQQASSYLRAFFPRLYITLFTTTFIAALAAIDETAQSTLSIVAIFFIVSFWPLTPAINSATDTTYTDIVDQGYDYIYMVSVVDDSGLIVNSNTSEVESEEFIPSNNLLTHFQLNRTL